jgi:hypothetical protein
MKRSVFLAGLGVGAASGLLLAVWPTLGLLIAVGFAIPAAISRGRLAALGGLLVGLPSSWLAVIGFATARCAEFNAQAGQGCIMADAGPWPAVALGLLLLGVGCSLAAARR